MDRIEKAICYTAAILFYVLFFCQLLWLAMKYL